MNDSRRSQCGTGASPVLFTMHGRGARATFACLFLTCLLANLQAVRAEPLSKPIENWSSRLESDWLTEVRVRWVDAKTAGPVKTSEDALGGCDGIKNGKWGFHTAITDQPAWWHVDLGQAHRLSRVLVYNRCETAGRTAKLQLLLSDDAKNWRPAYTHNGTPFYGFTDNKPLTIALDNVTARFVRLQLPPGEYFNLDEVEVYGADDPKKNLALHQPADQSSVSQWSVKKMRGAKPSLDLTQRIAEAIERGRKLAEDLHSSGMATDASLASLKECEQQLSSLKADDIQTQEKLYIKVRWTVRKLALANPVLDFDSVLFVKRAPAVYSHMSDQFYSWWSRPGGGVYILEGIQSDSPRLRCLTEQFPEGSFLSPDLSYDGKKVLFSFCRYYQGRIALRDKVDKQAQPEDSFYHVFEMNLDGTGLRQITTGRYDDTFPRYLPNGEIVFLSTRRGQFLQCGKESATATLADTQPDSFVRCGGDPHRPVSIYTLHAMDHDGKNMRAISAFESFEWDPSVSSDGRVFYARWDYVDRDNMPFMKLWSTNPDGTNPQAVFGNFTRNPHCIFEARSIPNSRKLLCTASGHHSQTAGSLVLLDLGLGVPDGEQALARLTPEVCFPEVEGWPQTYYNSPYPLSEKYYLTAWSNRSIHREGGQFPQNALGIYLYDCFGNLELLHRDPDITSMYPLPIRPRPVPPSYASSVAWDGPQEGRFFLQNVYEGMTNVPPGSIKSLRIVAMPIKTQPNMNTPHLGITRDDPGKLVLGTVPVEADGSAHFRVPSGVAVFFQALDEQGRAVQTMRSLTYVQPGQTLSCVGCHEGRHTAPPPTQRALAAAKAPARLTPGPEGSWPMRYDRLVQPVLDRHCVNCHKPGATDKAGAKFDLTAARSYDTLIGYGKPSLAEHVRGAYSSGRSVPLAGASHTSPLLKLLTAEKAHYDARLDADGLSRLVLWMDTYAQKLGHFSDEQEERLVAFRKQMVEMLAP